MKTQFYVMASILIIIIAYSIISLFFQHEIDLTDILLQSIGWMFFGVLAFGCYKIGLYYEKKEDKN